MDGVSLTLNEAAGDDVHCVLGLSCGVKHSAAVWRMLHCHAALQSAGEEEFPLTSQGKPLDNVCSRTKEQVFLPGGHRNSDFFPSSCLICIQQQNCLVPCSRECQGGQSAEVRHLITGGGC